MATTITIDPITRIEGHLGIDVTVDDVGGEQLVVDARCSGTMFRAFELMLLGRDPRDAAQLTQRVCGVCPVSHAMSSTLALDQAFGVTPPSNGRLLRNLVLGANFIQSHLLHFYHLSVLDYVDTTGLLDMAPWIPRYSAPDMVGGEAASNLVGNYLQALAMRRKAHQMGAIFGGKLPCTGAYVVGGCTERPDDRKIADFRSLLGELRDFIDTVYLADAETLGELFPRFFDLGAGPRNLLAFGVFDLDSSGTSQLLAGGRISDGIAGEMDPAAISESVGHSWYADGAALHPAVGETIPDADKPGAYTWLKAPRYEQQAYELGPLARMSINGLYDNGISALDRIVARAQETKVIADAMHAWLDELDPAQPAYEPSEIPVEASGAGLTEAPRGALGHWMDISESTVSRYQVVTPTNWNASPLDDLDQPGPIEEALIGVPVDDLEQPIDVLRVVHTFDPCLACGVHMMRPGDSEARITVPLLPSPG